MDTLRLLSRGIKLKGRSRNAQHAHIPSEQPAKPQLFSDDRPTKKRRLERHSVEAASSDEQSSQKGSGSTGSISRSLSDRKALLKQHKIKVTWLQPPPPLTTKKSKRSTEFTNKSTKTPLYPDPLISLDDLERRCDVPPRIARNIRSQGYCEATEVQMSAIPLLCKLEDTLSDTDSHTMPRGDLPHFLCAAPTGSGKTLAFLIPTMARLSRNPSAAHAIRAVILAPTKELVGQIVNEGKILARGTDLKITAFKKEMRLFGQSVDEGDTRTVSKPDILVSTPGSLAIAVKERSTAALKQVRYLILDEADVLLDPLFREQTVTVWTSLPNPNLRATLWSATMGSNIEDLATSLIRQHADMTGESANATPLLRLVVGLKDSAVPNVQHRLVYAATEQGKLMGLRQLLHPSSSSADTAASLRPPFIVFTQTIERAIALHSELLYDIPAAAGGSSRIAVLHSDLSDSARSDVMTRFRQGEIWVLITTDLLSRGIDFRGVNGVVNYDIPNSSAAYVHRAGRTGRAGREGGIAITLYSKEDIPYLKHIANVIAAAQKQGKTGDTDGSSVQQWLLDALPVLSKNEKQKFKKHGISARTSDGVIMDPKAAREARISTKAGFVRRTENNRRGAIEASRRRKAQQQQQGDDADDHNDDGDDEEFSGFE